MLNTLLNIAKMKHETPNITDFKPVFIRACNVFAYKGSVTLFNTISLTVVPLNFEN